MNDYFGDLNTTVYVVNMHTSYVTDGKKMIQIAVSNARVSEVILYASDRDNPTYVLRGHNGSNVGNVHFNGNHFVGLDPISGNKIACYYSEEHAMSAAKFLCHKYVSEPDVVSAIIV